MSRKRFPPHARTTSTRKQLSQNFLVDPRAAQTIVRAAGVGATTWCSRSAPVTAC